jgi:riboflavin synthase
VFTGLIQGLGTIKPLGGDSWQVTCVSELSENIMKNLAYGDSVAVDGVCLTVEDILPQGFTATASPETLKRSNLGQQQEDTKYVNLETSLRVGSKVGGHFVMGHVDGIGRLVSAEETATSWEMTFIASEAIDRYIVPKGSIAINGISLTVAEYQSDLMQFKVAVIPVTYADTNLRYLRPGSWVNLEGDILGKYVEKFIFSNGGHGRHTSNHNNILSPENITEDFLAENGYL